jgi:hypothetical protein
MQACDGSTASSWVAQHLLQLPTPAGNSSDSSSSNNCWLDAGSCCLMACQCNILQRLGQGALLQGNSQALIAEHLSQLWLTAQQVGAARQDLHNFVTDRSACADVLTFLLCKVFPS